MPQADAVINLPDASVGQSNANIDLPDVSMEPAGIDVDRGDANRLNLEVWDSNSGLKPLQSDGNESDNDIEVEDCDPQDFKWLPPKLQKRVVPKKIGMISFTARVMRELTMGSRRAEAALSWP